MKNALFLILFMSLTLCSCEKEALTGDVQVAVEEGSGDIGIFDPIVLSDDYRGRFHPQNAIRTAEDVSTFRTFEGLNPGNYVCAALYSSGTYYTTFQVTAGEITYIEVIIR